MPQVEIPQDLFQQVQQALPVSGSPDQFVSQAVREKLDKQEQRGEFLRLVAKNREAMVKQGLTEEQIVADFDAFCDKISVSGGEHLTLEALHENHGHLCFAMMSY